MQALTCLHSTYTLVTANLKYLRPTHASRIISILLNQVVTPGGYSLQALRLGARKEMDSIHALSAVKQQLRAARKSLGKKKSPSLFEFAREVSSQLHHEIKALSKKNKKHSKFVLVLQDKLSDFQKHLVAPRDALISDDNSNILIALDMLERLCNVS
jgi:gas vesicle protein